MTCKRNTENTKKNIINRLTNKERLIFNVQVWNLLNTFQCQHATPFPPVEDGKVGQ